MDPKRANVSEDEIARAIAACGGNISKASESLGFHRSFLNRRGYMATPPEKPKPQFPEALTDKPVGHWTDILKHAADASTIRKSMNPSAELGTATIKGNDPIGVFLISDLHLGSPQCDYLTFLKHVALLKEIPNLYAIVQGDVLEYAISQRMLDSVLSQALSPQEQAQLWKDIVDDLADKLLAAVIGNHELRAERMGAFDVGLYMYQKLIAKKKAYMKDGGTLRIKLGQTEYTWRVTHGDSRFGSMYTKTHKPMQLSRMSFGFHDIQSTGHTHEAAIYCEEQPQADGQGTRTAVALQAGSYKVNGGEQYPDRLGFMRSSQVRMPGVILFPDEKRIIPFYNVENMVIVLRALNGRKA